ncbi:MAG: pyrroline-5-carboxylate reductase [Deltaproteobacteria bacterium]|nr:pyrroline-5-carboxylate reductase [Deltaproteobacteria bacterium]
MKLGVLGTGNMAGAIIGGVLGKKVLSSSQIIGFDVDRGKLAAVRRTFKIRGAASAREVCKKADVVLLAVKPQDLPALLTEVKAEVKNQLWLSIAAGIDIKTLKKYLGAKAKIIRLMPNTPAMLGLGATAFTAGANCSARDKKTTLKIFGAVGDVLEMKSESKLDAVTGLSGSGPAYVYAFIGALIRAGIEQGLGGASSRRLALQTVLGATTLMNNSRKNAEELISIVASKKGTTEAGLKVLRQKGFEKIVRQCVKKATERARQLRK